MPIKSQDTCWSVLRAATGGDEAARSFFAHNYMGPVRQYLMHRWRGSNIRVDLDDAVQEVFVECIKPGGALERADPERGSFRGLLYGVARNTARRFEEGAAKRRHLDPDDSVYLDELPAQEEALSRIFDRAWAQSLVREAVLRYSSEAHSRSGDYRRRYRVLRLRHQRGLPVREIAKRLDEPNVDAVHNQYRRARREFRGILCNVVATHTGASGTAVDAEVKRLTALLES